MENFNQHLAHITQARDHAAALMDAFNPDLSAAEAILGLIWENVFDALYQLQQGSGELSELNTLSGVVQKLVSSGTQLKALNLKAREDTRKALEFTLSHLKAAQGSAEAGLTQTAIEEIEQQLKLL